MKMLAIDASAAVCSVVFADELSCIVATSPGVGYGDNIFQLIDAILPCQLAELDVLSWGCGPGRFTGVRLLAALMQALAFVHKLPTIAISSLAALAQAAYNVHQVDDIGVAIVAGKDQVYHAHYKFKQEGGLIIQVPEVADVLVSQAYLRDYCQSLSEDIILLGDAWSLEDDKFGRIDNHNNYLSAIGVYQLALPLYISGNYCSDVNFTPNYLFDNLFVSAV